jgi:hypothetical protein
MIGIKHDKHLQYGPLTCQKILFLGISPVQQVIWVTPGLDEVEIEPRSQGVPAVEVLPIPCNSHHERVSTNGHHTQPARQFCTVHAGQLNIEQKGVERFSCGPLERLAWVVFHCHVVPIKLKKNGQHCRCISVVVYHQDAQTASLESQFGFAIPGW